MNYPLIYQWATELATHLPCFNSWQIENIALFTLGIIQSQSSQQDNIARQVICGERVESASRRLRRFIANDKVDMNAFFEDWTRWVVTSGHFEKLTLLIDETKLHDKLGVMMVGLAWEGRCIPLAWRCYQANNHYAYPAEGQVKVIEKLLTAIQKALPDGQSVLVLADRGIGTSPELCRVVEKLGWHYLFRVTCQTKIICAEAEYTIAQTVQAGHIWQASGKIFKKRGQIPAHARAIWTDGYDEPWALVTNDARLAGFEYASRNWQEQSFRDLKSYGWQWEGSKVRNPQKMERMCILLVIAYAWVIALGCYAVQQGYARRVQHCHGKPIRRFLSLFKEGLIFFYEYVLRLGCCLTLLFAPDSRFT